MTDPNAHATLYAYNDYRFPTKATVTTDPMSVAVTFDVFDAFGNQSLTGPGNPYSSGTPTCPASYGATPAGDTSNLYNSEGQLGTTTDPNGITITYNYGDARFPTAPKPPRSPRSVAPPPTSTTPMAIKSRPKTPKATG